MSIYEEYGYENRKDYLRSLADEYEVSLDYVLMIASIYGKNEDFDGLVTALEDYF